MRVRCIPYTNMHLAQLEKAVDWVGVFVVYQYVQYLSMDGMYAVVL